MGFFDGLVTPDPEPEPEPPPQDRLLPRYTPPADGHGEWFAPEQWFAPAWVECPAEVGRGPETRIMLNGWKVWRHSATIRLSVHLSRRKASTHSFHPVPQYQGLRFGLLFADGRRVTTLDQEPWPPGHTMRPTLTLLPGMGGGHHYKVNLHLSHLPPEGRLRLVTEWPGQGVAETWTELDASAVCAASLRAVEVWPELDPPPAPEAGAAPQLYVEVSTSTGASALMARPSSPRPPMPPTPAMPPMPPTRPRTGGLPRPAPMPQRAGADRPLQPKMPPPPPPVAEQGDWKGMDRAAWEDVEFVRTRLAHGADPNHVQEDGATLLHVVAECGSPDVVAELAKHVADVNVRHAWEECTPLWQAVVHHRADNAAALLAAGADAWAPVVGERSAGWLGLRTDFASIFESLPDCVPLTAAERAAQADADARIQAFMGVPAEGMSIAFVADLSEEDAVRRLGSDPQRSPVLDLDAEPGPHGTGPHGFNPHDRSTAQRFLGVTEIAGGCVIVQHYGRRAAASNVLEALSPGTRAYGVHLCVVKATRGRLVVDGRVEVDEEIGLSTLAEDPDTRWLYRFWQWNPPRGLRTAAAPAYASAMAGMRITDGEVISRPPRRWVELAADSPLLQGW